MKNETEEIEITLFDNNGSKIKYTITTEEFNEFDKLTDILKFTKHDKESKLTKSRYYNLRNLAWQMLLTSGVNTLPLDLIKIADANNYKLLSYEKNALPVNIIDKFKVKENRQGFSFDILDRGVICYAEIPNLGRQRFTIAHEMGHLALNHSNLNISNFEQEASMFARRLLAPMGILNACKVTCAEEISTLCGMSLQASEYAYNRLTMLIERGKFNTSNLEVQLCKQFENFISIYLKNK